jgi:Ca2+-binding EF-hand superfamily protein
MIVFRTLAIAGLMLATTAVASAGPGRGGPARHYEKLAAFDKNKDGKLDDAELAALKAARQQKRAQKIATYDKDKDGKLDAGERAAMRKTRRAARFQALDTNKDGAISRAEFEAGAGKMGKHRGRHGAKPGTAR